MENEILKLIEDSPIITIFGHVYPDGDCYGSQVGMYEAIKTIWPDKEVYLLGSGFSKSPATFHKPDEVTDDVIQNSLAIILDVANMARIEDQRFSQAPKSIKIDHHILAEHFGTIELIDNSAVATCEILSRLFHKAGYHLSASAASGFFLGLTTDSGRFMYSPTNAETFEEASLLLQEGAAMEEIYEILYEADDNLLRFKGYIYSHYKISEKGIAYLTLPKEILHQYGIDANLGASLVNTIASIKGCYAWVFFSENDDGVVRVELRSSGVPVQPVAVLFNGGGHPRASGCKLEILSDYTKVIDALEQAVEEYLCTKVN